MTMAQTLINLGEPDRNLHLYDTFSGMSALQRRMVILPSVNLIN